MKTHPLSCWLLLTAAGVVAAEVEPQPFLAATQRLIDATNFLGSPFSADEITTLKACIQASDATKAQTVLDAHALFHVTISPEQRVKVAAGTAKPVLDEARWRQYLVRVDNEAGVTAKLAGSSPQAKEEYVKGSPPVVSNSKPRDPGEPALSTRWLDMQMFEAPPIKARWRLRHYISSRAGIARRITQGEGVGRKRNAEVSGEALG